MHQLKLGNNFRDRGVVCKFPYGREGVTHFEVTDHKQKESWANSGSLWNSGHSGQKCKNSIFLDKPQPKQIACCFRVRHNILLYN